MKNKSKLNKIKNGNNHNPLAPSEWFYMNTVNITVSDIKNALSDNKNLATEVWEAAGIIEIVIPEAKSIDMEAARPVFKDEVSNKYLKDNNINSLFYVTIDPDNYNNVVNIMRSITNSIGGFFCGDTEDFSPIIK